MHLSLPFQIKSIIWTGLFSKAIASYLSSIYILSKSINWVSKSKRLVGSFASHDKGRKKSNLIRQGLIIWCQTISMFQLKTRERQIGKWAVGIIQITNSNSCVGIKALWIKQLGTAFWTKAMTRHKTDRIEALSIENSQMVCPRRREQRVATISSENQSKMLACSKLRVALVSVTVVRNLSVPLCFQVWEAKALLDPQWIWESSMDLKCKM